MHTQALALANDHVVMTIAPVITFKKTDGLHRRALLYTLLDACNSQHREPGEGRGAAGAETTD